MEASSTSRSWARAIAKIGRRAKRTSPRDVKPFAKRQENDASKAEMSRASGRFNGPLEANKQAGRRKQRGRFDALDRDPIPFQAHQETKIVRLTPTG